MKQHVQIRPYIPGEPSLVCNFQYMLYEQQYHFNAMYEKEMLKGMWELYEDTKGSQLWVAVQNNTIVGSIAIIKRGEHKAQLRWFGVAMELQGHGVGNRLMQTAMNFCREKGYTHIYLGTLDILQEARHLYSKYGFQLVESEPFDEWADNGKMSHETWECHQSL